MLHAIINYKISQILNEIPFSIYTLLKTNMLGHTSPDHSHQLSLMIQSLKKNFWTKLFLKIKIIQKKKGQKD